MNPLKSSALTGTLLLKRKKRLVHRDLFAHVDVVPSGDKQLHRYTCSDETQDQPSQFSEVHVPSLSKPLYQDNNEKYDISSSQMEMIPVGNERHAKQKTISMSQTNDVNPGENHGDGLDDRIWQKQPPNQRGHIVHAEYLNQTILFSDTGKLKHDHGHRRHRRANKKVGIGQAIRQPPLKTSKLVLYL